MSLRSFHLLFIALSVVLAAFVAAWSAGQYQVARDGVYVASGLGSAVAAALLVVYGAKFQRRTRQL
jgi:hypothetical protein